MTFSTFTSAPLSKPSIVRWKRLLAVFLLLLLPQQVLAGVITRDFNCGSTIFGNLTVKHDDAIQFFGSPFRVVAGDDSSFSTIAGMNITATAVPKAGINGEGWAWMQAITGSVRPDVVRDKNRNVLAAPFPDTPPGGYIFDRYGPLPEDKQIFDSQPWYGNNQVGNLTLFDQPKSPSDSDLDFESWLVCVVATHGPPGIRSFDVIPLIGFTWGFDVTKGADGPDIGNIAGDTTAEYAGSTFRGVLVQGGQPSATFKTGYDKYFHINYLENNDANCKLGCVPEPGTFVMFAIALVSFGTCPVLRRQGSRTAA